MGNGKGEIFPLKIYVMRIGLLEKYRRGWIFKSLYRWTRYTPV